MKPVATFECPVCQHELQMDVEVVKARVTVALTAPNPRPGIVSDEWWDAQANEPRADHADTCTPEAP